MNMIFSHENRDLQIFNICLQSLQKCREDKTLPKNDFIKNIKYFDSTITDEEIENMINKPLIQLLEL